MTEGLVMIKVFGHTPAIIKVFRARISPPRFPSVININLLTWENKGI